MKTLYYFLFLFLIPVLLKGQQASLVIISEPSTNGIRYWPLDGRSLPFHDLATVPEIDTDGIFRIKYPAEEPVVLNVLTSDRRIFRAYLTAGSNDTVYLQNKQPEFKGMNQLYNQSLQQIQQAETYANSYSSSREHELASIASAEAFDRIRQEKQATLLASLEGKGFSPEFIRSQSVLVDCIFTHLFYQKVLSLDSNSLNEQWMTEISKQLAFDFQQEEALCYSQYQQMLKINTTVRFFILEKRSSKELNREEFNTFQLNEYKKIVTGKYLEHAWACLLYNDLFQQDFSKDIPELYDSFCTAYPSSRYIRVLHPVIDKAKRFHSKASTEKQLIILPSDSTIQTLEEAVKPFKGKVVYVDLWATWCSPCQKMFAYGDAMKKATEEMDIVYLYISIDRPENQEKWEKMISYYHLKGYHLLANEAFTHSLCNSLGNKGMISIPQFVIIGKDGKVAIERAASPQDTETVVEQLKQIAK